MARYIKLHRRGTTSLFWKILGWIVAFLLGLGVSVVVWVVTGQEGDEWVVLAIGGGGIVGFFVVRWLTGGGLPPIARFRILNEASDRPAARSSLRLNEDQRFEDEHHPPLVKVGGGAPNAAAYDLEPYEAQVASIEVEVMLEGEPEPLPCNLRIELEEPAWCIEDAEVVLRAEDAELVVLLRHTEESPPFVLATAVEIPPVEPNPVPPPGPGPGPSDDD